MSRWMAALVSVLVAAGVLTSTMATCVEGALMPKEQQAACCATGHEHCTQAGTKDCCKKTEPRQPQLITAKADVLKAPVRHLLAWLTVAAIPATFVVDASPLSYVDTSPPISPKAPTYIRLSILRI